MNSLKVLLFICNIKILIKMNLLYGLKKLEKFLLFNRNTQNYLYKGIYVIIDSMNLDKILKMREEESGISTVIGSILFLTEVNY
ncbi:MAG: hypothetical protein ACOCP8_05450 [archaeon]